MYVCVRVHENSGQIIANNVHKAEKKFKINMFVFVSKYSLGVYFGQKSKFANKLLKYF